MKVKVSVAWIALSSWLPWHPRVAMAKKPNSTHRVRVDLKPRAQEDIEKVAHCVSMPFPNNCRPLEWQHLIDKNGRTRKELDSLKVNLVIMGGNIVNECPSQRCIIADIASDDNVTTTNVEGVVHGGLRYLLRTSGKDDTIVRGVKRLVTTKEQEDRSETRTKNTKDKSTNRILKGGSTKTIEDKINEKIMKERDFQEIGTTLNDLNHLNFFAFPVYCAAAGSANRITLESVEQSCPINITISSSPWNARELSVSSQQEIITISTEDLPSQTCESILGRGKCFVNEEVTKNVFIGGESLLLNVTMKWRNDTIVKIINFADYLSHGVAHYNINGMTTFEDAQITVFYAQALVIGPTITPSYANMKYNVPDGHQGEGLGITALLAGLPNAYSKKALEAANSAFNLPTPDIQLYTSKLFPGMNYSQCFLEGQSCSESNLDIQSITQYGTGAEFGFIPSNNLDFDLNDSIVYDQFVGYREALIEKGVVPDVLSLSWGGLPSTYDDELDGILAEFNAVGITVLVATGDRGVIGSLSDLCTPSEYAVDVPSLPDMSSWVLAVGATQEAYLSSVEEIGTVACMGPTSQMITSAGRIFPADQMPLPDYQAKAVTDYIKGDSFKHWPFSPLEIPSPGRGVPDVSAYGANIPITLEQDDGEIYAFAEGGTSASAPAFAGLLLQVRGALLASPECANKDITFGHINPMIYWAASNRPESFTDITVGNNVFDGQKGYEYNIQNCGQGFTTAKGWDPVTGVGMMNFPKFVDAAKEYYCTGIVDSSDCSTANLCPSPMKVKVDKMTENIVKNVFESARITCGNLIEVLAEDSEACLRYKDKAIKRCCRK